MKIQIETIPHNDQRYETVGDWIFDANGTLQIKVSELGDWRQEMCVAVHELVEVLICKHRGITQEQADKFDADFESERERKLEAAKTEPEKELLNIPEPGDDGKCPYKNEHSVASGVERILGAALEVDWEEYSKKLEGLAQT